MSRTPEQRLELLRARVTLAVEYLNSGIEGARGARDGEMGWPGAYGFANATMGQAVVDLLRALEDSQ